MRNRPIPIIDLFAGPGGLSEGFSALRTATGNRCFKVALSIEKDPFAHKTLFLRSFLRQFEHGYPDEYYAQLRLCDEPLDERLATLFNAYLPEKEKAEKEVWLAELGVTDRQEVSERASRALGGSTHWVLIGGPPCQAYSVVGRSRNKGTADYVARNDKRNYLYVEYLHLIAEHTPAAFVMENVKGLLSARVENQRMFERILHDLQNPVDALVREGRAVKAVTRGASSRYRIYSLIKSRSDTNVTPSDYVVPMEYYGVPQARHRIILVGIRDDLGGDEIRPGGLLKGNLIPAERVLNGLPRLRSGISRSADSDDYWKECLQQAVLKGAFDGTCFSGGPEVLEKILCTLDKLSLPKYGRGREFLMHAASIDYREDWYLDPKLGGVLNHSSRSHMVSDLYRYLYAAAFAKAKRRSPVISDFPSGLLPRHENVKEALEGAKFADRFRVKVEHKPSTTITSHISKDGHYYIHYDLTQCRSLTVREAARLQTFPDNYFFCGPRTEQYRQVGNAVPPLLAQQIAAILYEFLKPILRNRDD